MSNDDEVVETAHPWVGLRDGEERFEWALHQACRRVTLGQVRKIIRGRIAATEDTHSPFSRDYHQACADILEALDELSAGEFGK